MSISSRHVCLSFCCMLLLIGIVGCGGGPTSINGQVKYKGDPVTGGIITFHFGKDKNSAYGSIDASGNYAVQSTVTGNAKVTINTDSVKNAGAPLMHGKTTKEGMPQMPGGAAAANTSYMKIPPKYADEQQTTLEYMVTSGPQKKNFDLTD